MLDSILIFRPSARNCRVLSSFPLRGLQRLEVLPSAAGVRVAAPVALLVTEYRVYFCGSLEIPRWSQQAVLF